MKISHLVLSLTLAMMSACSQAEPPVQTSTADVVTTVAANSGKAEETIRASFKNAIPYIEIASVKQSVAGLYEIKLKPSGIVYMSADGRYMLQGELMELDGTKLTNITEQGMAAHRKELLASVPLKDMVIFPAANGKAKGVAYVFTDVDCGYCRKIHEEIPVLSQMGIEIRYLAFPRAGYPSPTSQKMDAIWCATDRNAAMTAMKRMQPVTPASCQNPIKQQYELGKEIGVHGTPAVYSEDGKVMGGYVSAKDMAAMMKIK